MKKLFLTGLLLVICVFFSWAHPLHVSILNISIQGRSVQVSIKTFVDDWETAYFHYFSKPIDLKMRENYMGTWFTEYFSRSWEIREKENMQPIGFITDTVYFDELSMTIEMHGELTRQPNSLYIYNSILTDIFPDQTNLAIISKENRETGVKFDYKTKQKMLKLR